MVTLAESTNVTTGAQRRIAPSKSVVLVLTKTSGLLKSAVSLSGLNVLVLTPQSGTNNQPKTFAEIFRKSGVSPRRAASSPAKIYPPSLENRKVRSSPRDTDFDISPNRQSLSTRAPFIPKLRLPGPDLGASKWLLGN